MGDSEVKAFCSDKSASKSVRLKLLSEYFKSVRPDSLAVLDDRKTLSSASLLLTMLIRGTIAGAYGVSLAYIVKSLGCSKSVSAVLGVGGCSLDLYFEWKQFTLKRIQLFDKYEHSVWKSLCSNR